MEQQKPGRTCPACGSSDYLFRSRRKIEAEKGEPEVVETKYRCRACGKDWQEKVPK
jgi:transposase-like protein